ncbi:phosphonate ABC transporter substrate-binding protein [Betaproteobacteria bacterium]|nr:phosphonate ABC transporter substrate-binding protein [Betaproteobacteria bacterium]GHU41750.1 phosphonate ABC transporter substrate-binding protein [Betaproteobacteria bacterium]
MNTHIPVFNLRRRHLLLGAAGFLCLARARAQNVGQGAAKVYSLGIHPVVSPQRVVYSYQPLTEYLNHHPQTQNAQLRIETSRSLDLYRADLEAARFAFTIINPYDIPLALRAGYRLFARFGDEKGYGGILLTRKDSGIEQVADLRGKTICYSNATALAATMLNQYFLWQHGLDIVRDVKHVYLNSLESVYLQVMQGKAAAGGSLLFGWNFFSKRVPEAVDALEIKWQTPPLPGFGIMARGDIPEELIAQLRETLLSMHQTPDGQNVLETIGLPRFSPATHETYAEVEHFIREFREHIGNPGEI